MAFVFASGRATAAIVQRAFSYTSSISSNAASPLLLTAELNYNPAVLKAPVAVVMHGFSLVTGGFEGVRANAQRLAARGFFAVSVAMRGRDGAQGVRDSGGLEIYDIVDAVAAVRAAYPALCHPERVYITGYSGGGGNVMSALTKFPDFFTAGSSFFGISDYGFSPENSWFFKGTLEAHRVILIADVGDPRTGDPAVMDRYRARASNLASVNNPYSEIHLFVNSDETICPPVNHDTYRSAALANAAFPGEFTNITVHVGRQGLFHDFNRNGRMDLGEEQYWPHDFPTESQQKAAESWFLDRLLSGAIRHPVMSSNDTLFVAGYVRCTPFEFRLGDGQDGAAGLAYTIGPTNAAFRMTLATSRRDLTGRLDVRCASWSGQRVDVYRNNRFERAVRARQSIRVMPIADGETWDLRPAGRIDCTSVRSADGQALELDWGPMVPGESVILESLLSAYADEWLAVGSVVTASTDTVTLIDPDISRVDFRMYRCRVLE